MFDNIIQSTTVPVLEQVVAFAQKRHNVLAGNIANIDTPGYQVRDISVENFQRQLQEAIAARHQPTAWRSPGEVGLSESNELAEIAENSPTILRHDGANVGIEQQATEMVKNQMQHNLAMAIMASQFRLLNVAISERV
jgi:flagellar basal-body rod protein FlgB